MGRECSLSKGRGRLYSGGIQVGGVRGGSQSVRSRDAADEAAPRVLNLEKVLSTLNGTIWGKVLHCTDLPRQVTFPAHTEQEKMGLGFG